MTDPMIRKRKLTDYKPDPANANKGTERGWRMVNDSLKEDGAGRSIVVTDDDTIVAGNKTAENAADLGYDEVIEVETTGRQLVVVKRTDWADIDDPNARRYAYRDNRAGELSLAWDTERIMADLGTGVLPEGLFSDEELAAIVETALPAEAPPGDPGAQLDRAEQLRAEWQVERGQVWVIRSQRNWDAEHRLMCGDSYDEEHRARLLAGVTPGLLNTDPPYGIDIVKPRRGNVSASVGGAKPFGKTSGPGNRAIWDAGKDGSGAARGHVQHGEPSKNQIIQSNLYPVIEGDDRPFDPTPFLDLAPIVVLWGANYFADQLPISSCWICWDKREDITRNNFADGELAWTNLDKPMRVFHHLWNGLHKGSQHGERRTHPTEKPVALFAEIGNMYCPGGVWLDLFAGTGAQLVAAEQNAATCYAMEYEPLYVAVTLQRLADMGLAPVLEGTA